MTDLHEWDFIEKVCNDFDADFEAIKASATSIQPRARMQEIGLVYQHYLYAIVRAAGIPFAVETGVRTGVSTKHLMEALVAKDVGLHPSLYSCDPMYRSEGEARVRLRETVALPDTAPWKFYGARSVEALVQIARDIGLEHRWPLFVHDSDHGLENMAFELEFGWAMLAPGGFLICDDWIWPNDGSPSHKAADRFAERHKLELHRLGSACAFEKEAAEDDTVLDPVVVRAAAIKLAIEEVRRYGRGMTTAYDCYLAEAR